MTDETAHPTDETGHATMNCRGDRRHRPPRYAAHGDTHATTGAGHATASGDDHGHDGPALGPIDWGKWAVAVVGGLGGLIVLGFFLYALGGLPT